MLNLQIKQYQKNTWSLPKQLFAAAVTRIRTWVTSATTKGTNHYTITAIGTLLYTVIHQAQLVTKVYSCYQTF